ncbi:MAG: prepilin-type N-terminal cleavage/methylation domain-containing protein [Candidatus Omnitrophota bacterium]
MKKGFTLLELLVVVIIIAILASIAIPQFFNVAERARSSEGASVIGTLRRAQVRYNVEHGVYTTSTADLDVDVTTLKYFDAPTLTGTIANLASVKRSLQDLNTSKFEQYTLRITEGGTIECVATAAADCPPGYTWSGT